MEQKIKDALLRVLDNGEYKNVLALGTIAGIDPAGLSRYVNTLRAKIAGDPLPKNPKDSMNLSVASKLVDCLGGNLIFPWESPEACALHELEEAKKQIESQREEIIALRAVNQAYERLLSGRGEEKSAISHIQRTSA